MKRRVTVEEFERASAPKAGILDRVLDFVIGPHQTEFYPTAAKRAYFEDGTILKSISLADGKLFGGCCKSKECFQTCVPIEEFTPEFEGAREEFVQCLESHNHAVASGDVEVAFQFRKRLEELRSPLSYACRAKQKQDEEWGEECQEDEQEEQEEQPSQSVQTHTEGDAGGLHSATDSQTIAERLKHRESCGESK